MLERQSVIFLKRGISARTGISALLCVTLLGAGFAQVAKRRAVSKGPRALGLVQIAADGHAQLVPVTIMLDGRFYDASAYKADPVPMALQQETVYEAFATGVSQGLFTVGGAAQFHGNWFADGKWRSAEQIKADQEKAEAAKKAKSEPLPEDQIGGPPKLKRSTGSSGSAPASPAPEQKKPPADSKSNTVSTKPAAPNPMQDANRPILRRQPPSETSHEQTKSTPEPIPSPVRVIPAISDAGGPEARPYAYELKPDEQQGLLKKILALADGPVRQRIALAAPAATPTKSKSAGAPEFHDVNLRVFDLSNTNEAVLVLTASAHSPAASDLDFLVTLVARQDIYGDLHKVFAHVTDNKHLDAVPKYELIDAVDADGDGRGELLFREKWDSGSAFAVYRVIGDQFWPLFEGKPGT